MKKMKITLPTWLNLITKTPIKNTLKALLILVICIAGIHKMQAQTLVASYPLTTDYNEATSTYGAYTHLGTTAIVGGSLYSDGTVSCPGGACNPVGKTANITGLDGANFEIQLDYNPGSYDNKQSIITGSSGCRWVSIVCNTSGCLGFDAYNGGETYSTVPLTLGTWYNVRLQFFGGRARLLLDGVVVLDGCSPLTQACDNVFTTIHPGNATALHGNMKNLKFYNSPVIPATTAGSVSGSTSISIGSSTGTLTLSGNTGQVIRWQKSSNGGGSWTNIANTLSTYSEIPSSIGTWTYRVNTGGCPNVYSSVATVIVNTLTITSITPKTASIGSSITVNGTGFSTTAANNTVFIGGVKSVVTNATATDLTVTVPSSVAGRVMVNCGAKTATSLDMFFPQTTAQTIDANLWGKNVDYYNGVTGNSWPNWSSENVETADFNGDGKPDLVAINYGTDIKIFKNEGTANNISFTLAVTLSFVASDLCFGDFNADGKIDIAARNSNNNPTLKVYLNTSDATTISFATPISYQFSLGETSYTGITAGDYDGDGDDDIFMVGWNYRWFYTNNFDGTTVSFTASTKEYDFVGGMFFIAESADIDNDGKIDVVATRGNSDGGIAYFKNTSAAGVISFSFTNFGTSLSNRPSCLVLGDVDGDGKPDIVTGNGDNVSVYRNTNSVAGTPSFAAVTNILTGGRTDCNFQVRIADINADGKPDIIYNNNYMRVIPNNSTSGSLSFGTVISKTDASMQGYDFVVLDANNDGKLECVYNKDGSYLSYLKEQPLFTTWDGSAWDEGTPTSAKDAVIDGNYTIGVDQAGINMATKNLTINSGKTLTVGPNKMLTISGNYVNNGILTIKSVSPAKAGNSGDGSMLISGTATGTGTSNIERYLSAAKWHMISSSVTAAQTSVFTGLYLRP
ncbi:MAG: hypothetical protein HGB12_13690, partial [Bacteroidetes bacterium]|nr:hypothetical protein [Bacteroidota bacterium]